MIMSAMTYWWIAFIVIFLIVYFIDMYATGHRHGEISVKTSLRWTGLWISIALLFGVAFSLKMREFLLKLLKHQPLWG